MAVCDLNRRVPIAQSALSQHLARLRSAGLVVAQRDGPRPATRWPTPEPAG